MFAVTEKLLAVARTTATIAFFLAAAGIQQVCAYGEPAPLTTIASVRSLPRDRASLHLPVRITASVTLAVPQRWRFYAQDATGGIFFLPPNEYRSHASSPRLFHA